MTSQYTKQDDQGRTVMGDKLRAEVSTITGLVWDWHLGRMTQHDFVWRAGAIANQLQIDALIAMPKRSERETLVAVANILSPAK